MLRYLANLGIPPPKAFYSAAEFVLNSNLRRAFEGEEVDIECVRMLMEEAKLEGVVLDTPTLEYVLRQTIERLADQFVVNPADLALLQKLEAAVNLARSLPFEVNLWEPQNRYYEILKGVYSNFRTWSDQGDENAKAWNRLFCSLGEGLSIRVE
jgi:hypothetical protein